MNPIKVITLEDLANIPGATLHKKHSHPNTNDIRFLRSALLEAYEKYGWGVLDEQGEYARCEDSHLWKVSNINSLCAQWIYRLNNRTKEYIQQFNDGYRILPSSSYIALQIRLSDKMYEMDPHQCM